MKKKILSLLIIFVIAISCRNKVPYNYMQNIDELTTNASIANTSSTIQPGDQLSIIITADDMDVVAPFNQNLMSSENVNYNLPSGNSQFKFNNNLTPTYTVKTDGTISFPVLGNLTTSNKTLEQFTSELQEKMKKYVVNPIVNIKNINYKVTVLGQVNKPGTYTLPDGQATLLSALGLAGDLTIYGLRENILVVRNVNGEITKQKIDITKSDFINSPYYYIKQNDVIYVDSNSNVEKRSRLDPNASIYISVASIVVTILALVFKN